MRFTNILVPIDGSKASCQAGEVAINVANEWGGRVTFLYVINKKYLQKILDLSANDRSLTDLTKQFRQTGENCIQLMKDTSRKIGAKIETIGLILEGEPAEEIIHLAKKGDYDLIVIPVKDRDHTSPYLLGHVTERVIESGVRPVLTIPLHYSTDERKY